MTLETYPIQISWSVGKSVYKIGHSSLGERDNPDATIPKATTRWVVVVAQLAEWSLPIPEDLRSNPAIGNIYKQFCS